MFWFEIAADKVSFSFVVLTTAKFQYVRVLIQIVTNELRKKKTRHV